MRVCASLALDDIVKDGDKYIVEFYLNDKKDKFVLDVTDFVEDKISEINRINIKDNDTLLLKIKMEEHGKPIVPMDIIKAYHDVFKRAFPDNNILTILDIFNIGILSKEVTDNLTDKLNDIKVIWRWLIMTDPYEALELAYANISENELEELYNSYIEFGTLENKITTNKIQNSYWHYL